MGATAAYVSARSEILGAAAFLAALTFARRAVLTSDIGPAALAVGFGAVAAASSPAGAALPVVMLAYDRWVMRTKGWERRLWRLYLPLVTVAALTAAWRLQAALTVVHVPSRDFLENLMTESIVVWRYAGLLVFPAGQAIVHDVHWVTSPADPLALLALAAIAAAVASAVSFRRQAPLAAVCAIWFFAALAPTSSWIPLRDAMSEPRTYVAATGLFLAAAWLAAGPLATRRSARLVAVGVLVILAVVAHVRTRVWADPLRLWEESVRRAPEAWQAHLGYAESLREIQQCTRALPEYEATLSLYADEPQAIAGLKACRR